MKKVIFAAAIGLAMYSCKNDQSKTSALTHEKNETEQNISSSKIVSLSGGITEIVSALGHEQNIIATDVTSTFPLSLKNSAKDLGHVRSLTIEPILAQNPTLILASEKDMSPELIEKIKNSGIKTDFFTQEYSIQGTKELIKEVADVLGNTTYEKLNAKIDNDLSQIKTLPVKPKVLFIYARGNNLMVAGKNTAISNLIGIAGGQNAFNNFEDYKPLTPEAVIVANPDILLLFDSGLQGAGGKEAVLQMPGIAQTAAGKNSKIISIDGGLASSFGPRLGEAALKLNQLLIENTK